MIINNLSEILKKNRDETIAMFIIKNEQNEYLISGNDYFNYLSLPCLKLSKLDEENEEINNFLKKEYNFVGVLKRYIESLRGVAKIEGIIQSCNIVCFEIKADEELRETFEKAIPFNPDNRFLNKTYINIEDLKTYFWNKRLDQNSMYFIFRSQDEYTPTNINIDIFNQED